MDCIEYARMYRQHGFGIIPLKTNGTKQPTIAWKQYQQRYATDREINDWWGNGADRGIAVLSGAISNNLTVLDFDEDGPDTFARFWADAEQALPGITHKIVVVATPRPGRQVYFRQQSLPAGNQVLAYTEPRPVMDDHGNPLLDEQGQPLLTPQGMVETRGEGGYVAAVGSPLAVHRNGTPYQFIHGDISNLPPLSDAEVETLLNICRGYSRFSPKVVIQEPRPADYDGEPRPGDIYNQQMAIQDLLLQAGWQFSFENAGVEYWVRPGKNPVDGHSATVGHYTTADGRPLLYVFTDAALPAQKNTQYDAFGLFAELYYARDFSRAAAGAREMFADQYEKAQVEFHQEGGRQPPDSFLEFIPFPVESLPELLREYVVEQSVALGVEPSMVAVPLLSSLASLIGQARSICLRDSWTQPSILWTAVICGTGQTKSPAMTAAKMPAFQIERQLARTNKQLLAAYREEKTAYERDRKNNPKPDRPRLHQLFISNYTLEVLYRRIDANWKSLLVAKDELAGWAKTFNVYRQGRGGDVETWLTFWDGYAEALDRVTNDLHIDGCPCAISVTGTIQPAVARRVLLADEYTENGLACRLLFCHPVNQFVQDDGASKINAASRLHDQMAELGRLLWCLDGVQNEMDEREPIVLGLDGGARDLFFDFKNSIKQEAFSLEEGPLAGALSKMDNQAARIALVFAVVRQVLDQPAAGAMGLVTAQDMMQALSIVRWFVHESRRFFGNLQETEQESMFRKVLEYMRRKGIGEITPRDLSRGIRGIRTAVEAEALLKNMITAGHGEGVTKPPLPTGGRAKWVFRPV